ncbi:MAG: YifB family Mg chelatase-like AAA ATPase [Epsilonproteobacteria bacterium]|nr:YifB family Mg chelatase-like AAA ATPase [Campylobacterota bacterium]
MKSVQCATYEGIEAKRVCVEATLTKGLPSFSIVGMASTSITEAKERVKSALLSNEYALPPKRITISLSPSDVSKSGSQFDLSIALMILLNNHAQSLSEWYVFGELGLDGSVKENDALYPLILSLANQKVLTKLIVPYESLPKLSKIPNIELYGVKSLKEAYEFLSAKVNLMPYESLKAFEYPKREIEGSEYFYEEKYPKDFIDVKGQHNAKRAALIAAVGFHNIILEGSPGCGKSMIAQRLVHILPPLSMDEILEIAKLDILDSKEPSFAPTRRIRSPHHTSTMASIFGGGTQKAMIGEVGLANHSVLFFDELPHFSKNILEALREPMQDDKIRISRVNSKVEYGSKFLFIGAMNPCPCGNLLDETKECRCSEPEIKRYKNRLSDPFLDRIDLSVVMQNVKHDDKASWSSQEMHQMVIGAFEFQRKRAQKSYNAKLSDAEIERFCILSGDAQEVLQKAILRYGLSFRAIKKIQKVSRSIADLARSEMIEKEHLLEALSFRRR